MCAAVFDMDVLEVLALCAPQEAAKGRKAERWSSAGRAPDGSGEQPTIWGS